MNKNEPFLLRLGEIAIILIGILFVLLPTSPLNSPYTNRDSGVFLYSGWQILEGELPYVDFWDHKPPIIFYINALGLAITNNSRWGVWFIELISLFMGAYLGFLLLKKLFNVFAAILGTYVWLISLVFLISSGNFTEEYVLPLQFAALYLFYLLIQDNKGLKTYVIIGILGGIAFFTKQTSIGIWIAIIFYLLALGIKEKNILKRVKEIALILLGGFSVLVIIITYFYINNAHLEFWESAFLYNFVYSIRKVNSIRTRLWNFVEIKSITQTSIYQFSALGIVIFIVSKITKTIDKVLNSLLSIALINFVCEILLINLPGFTYWHYFITFLPTLALFSGFLFFKISSMLSSNNNMNYLIFVFILLTLSLLAFGSIRDYRNNYWELQTKYNEKAIEFIMNNSDSDDTILIWGAESMVNYYTQRKSPTKYVYQYPLYRLGYTSEERIIEFLEDILNKEPKFIIDSSRKDMPFLSFPIQNEAIQTKLDSINSIYKSKGWLNTWQIYELVSN